MVQGVSEHSQKSTSRQVRPSAIQCEPYNAWQVGGFNFYHGCSATGSSSAWLNTPPYVDGGKDQLQLPPTCSPSHTNFSLKRVFCSKQLNIVQGNWIAEAPKHADHPPTLKPTSSSNKTDGLRPYDKWLAHEGGVVQQAPKIVYKLVLEVGMINVSCWKLKRNTDENRAISKAILFNSMAVCLGKTPAPSVVSTKVFSFKLNRIFLDGLLCSLFWQPKLSIDKGLFVFFQPLFAGYLCKRMAILQK